jgi:hypothetical protein
MLNSVGRGVPPGTVNKQAGTEKAAVEGKLHRRGGRPLPMGTVNKHAGLRKLV